MELNDFYRNFCYSRSFKISTRHLVFGIYLCQLVVVCLQCYIDSTRLPTAKKKLPAKKMKSWETVLQE
ncbi:hypothetical protein JTE90_003243 [Oedothorax gibbosus]|uniref:ATP synthase F0 subunit 8 n=1 Tax=Oedothorax gibbosus TaxID=931172 RepID=A0AAV6UQ54_9ARAC|nr:hypothetical protein JTE90_003243 [Oedothorax gibbosus]